MSEPKTNFTNDKVNTLVNNLSEIFPNSAKSTFGTYCHKAGKTRQTKLKDQPGLIWIVNLLSRNIANLKENSINTGRK